MAVAMGLAVFTTSIRAGFSSKALWFSKLQKFGEFELRVKVWGRVFYFKLFIIKNLISVILLYYKTLCVLYECELTHLETHELTRN